MRTVIPMILFGLHLILPPALAVAGYLATFHDYCWYCPLGAFVGFTITATIITKAAKPDTRYSIYFQTTGVAIGWIWMLSIPASIWFFVSALFFNGSWWEFGYSFLVGGVAKSLTRSFHQSALEEQESKKRTDPILQLDVDEETLDIIADFGQCIADSNPAGVSFYDEKFFSHPKDTIFKALAKGINAAPNQET